MNAPDLLVDFTKADDNQEKRAMLMDRLLPVQRELVELYDKACEKAGFRGPGLHQPIVNEEG